jgi:cardiolipin synthase
LAFWLPSNSTRTRLTGAGIEVRNSPSSLTFAHSKVMILDQKHAVVMSANMNSYSMSSERNYGVIDDDPYDLSDLQAVFEADWNGTDLPSLSCTRLLISPVNSGYWIKNLISKSQISLELEVMYLTDSVIKAAVIAQSEAGVHVRVMLADPVWIDYNPATAAELAQAGIEVKYLMSVELHAKLIISDGVVFVGSENLSYGSLNKNREVGLFLPANSAGSTATISQFEADWKTGVVP